MAKYVWVGPRESDIDYCKEFFYGSITTFGSGTGRNTCYINSTSSRINHNRKDCVPQEYWEQQLSKRLEETPDIEFIYYDPLCSYSSSLYLQKRTACRNSQALLEILDNKITSRQLMDKAIPVIPSIELDMCCSERELANIECYKSEFILQASRSSGGIGTVIVSSLQEALSVEELGSKYTVSDFFAESFSVSLHFIIGSDDILTLPGSIQIVKRISSKMIFLGSDFIAFNNLNRELRDAIFEYGQLAADKLGAMNYRGIVGMDFLVTKNEIFFLEINPRFQASTFLINRALADKGFPCVQEMNMAAFSRSLKSYKDCFSNLEVQYSALAYVEGTAHNARQLIANLSKTAEVDCIKLDGYTPGQKVEPRAYLFRAIFNTNISSIAPDCELLVHENLLPQIAQEATRMDMHNLLNVKISLLNQGVKFTEKAYAYLRDTGGLKDAVFNAVDITIFDNLKINCPHKTRFTNLSPWEIDVYEEELLLTYRGNLISQVAVDRKDHNSEKLTSEGVSFGQICFWATDRLRISHTHSCHFKTNDCECSFCDIPKDAKAFSLNSVCEVIDYYLANHASSFRHFLIGGGSESYESERISIIKLARHIRSRSDKGVYAMCLPPKKVSTIKEFYDAGINEIAFNIEVFNQQIAKQHMPGKGRIPREHYFNALQEATKYWGKTGAVKSIVIAGLEEREYIRKGILRLCEIGVQPIISVLRPLKSTTLCDLVPPSNQWLGSLYSEAEEICRAYGLTLGPSCPECQNNTLSLPGNSFNG